MIEDSIDKINNDIKRNIDKNIDTLKTIEDSQQSILSNMPKNSDEEEENI